MIDSFQLMLGDYVNCTDKNGNTKPVLVDHIRNDLIRRRVDMYSNIKLTPDLYKQCGFKKIGDKYTFRDFTYFIQTGLFYKNIFIENQPNTLHELQNIVRILSTELPINFNNDQVKRRSRKHC